MFQMAQIECRLFEFIGPKIIMAQFSYMKVKHPCFVCTYKMSWTFVSEL
jgi:hypothetical protein